MSETKKVLVIDDEPDTVTFLRTWLEDNGYATCWSSDGSAGMEVVLRERPDLVLLDVNMPGRTGIQLYREMRGREECRDLPVIFITGLSEFQVFGRDCSLLPEPAACIEKPIDLQVLRSAIARAIG